MRSEEEIRKAIGHAVNAMAAAIENGNSEQYVPPSVVCEVLYWVLGDDNDFAHLLKELCQKEEEGEPKQ